MSHPRIVCAHVLRFWPGVAALLGTLLIATGHPSAAARRVETRSVGNLAPSQPVGTLPGSFGVDGNGAATWTLQVQVPPGTGGVAPSLQITYDSHRSNGYLGMGFSLSGISAITRCGANYRTDGFKAGVDYGPRDRYCLDGRRLIATSGSYGADGTVYHTEIETWTVLTSHGSCGSGPCSFTGTDKDGNTLSFGATTGATGSRILAQGRSDGAVRTWSIDTRTDLNGNAVGVVYVNDASSGEYYPQRIDYTSNASAGLAAQRSVRLDYESRDDVVKRFLAGSQILISQRLTAITTSVVQNGTASDVLRYRFAYATSPTTQRSRLQSVTLCDAAGICWPPSTFDWYTDPTTFAAPTTQLPGPTYVILDGRLYPFGVMMDFNGDGLADYSKAVEFVDGNRDLSVYLGRSDGSFERASYSLPGPVWRVTSESVVQTGALQDINGDGILDFSPALRNDDAGTADYTVYLGSGSGFVRQANYQLPGPLFWQVNGRTMDSGVLEDVNGDGIPDYSRATVLLATGETMLDLYKGTGTGFSATGTKLPGPLFAIDASGSRDAGILRDINGDGLADYSAATVNADAGSQDLRVFLGQSPDFTFRYAYDLPGQMIWIVNGQALASGALVDINGDGIPDYSRATELTASGERLLDVYLGTGGGYTPAGFKLPGPLYSILDGVSYVQGMLTNWNGDGTTRYSRATQWRDGTEDLALYLGSGIGFSAMGKSLPKAMFRVLDGGTYANAEYQDVNGDGVTDFVDSVCTLEAGGALSQCALGVQLANGPFSDLLQRVTNGFGGTVDVEYEALTAGLYTPAGTPTYPTRNVDGSMIVVSAYVNGDGRGNRYRYTYTYAGGLVDALGYGWLGFSDVTMTDVAGGRAAKSTYDQTYPFAGMVASSAALDGDGTLLARSVYTYVDAALPALQALGVHQPLRSSETMTQYTAGSADYTLQTQYQYDAYGNAALTAELGDASIGDDDLYTCVRYHNDAASGRYGYELQTKVDRTQAGCRAFLDAPDPAAITWDPAVDLRWSKKAYDANMNLVASSRYDDTHAAFLTDSFGFDAYGNILSATNAAGDTTTYAYDATYHTFRTTITSPPLTREGGGSYQLTTRTDYEPAFGVLIATTDPNGNVTSQEIDGFGRPARVYGPDDQGKQTLLVTTGWAASGGAYYLQTQQRPSWNVDDQTTWYWDRQYYDGLDRVYRGERYGVKDGQATRVLADTGFDAQGRVHTTTAPYYVGDPAPTTTIEYDVYNRPVLSTDPAGVQHKIDYAEGGRKITRTNAFGTPEAQTEITYLSGRGLVEQAVAPNGATTTYARDPLGQILSVTTAPEARLTTITYDSIGRQRTLTSSNTGTSSWTFDATGTLRQIVDGTGNVIAYPEYDGMGRLRQRTMTYAGGSASAVYVYDDPTYANGLGNLTGVQMNQGAAGAFAYTYGYTAYGQAKAGTMTLGGERYVYGSSYDPLGRLSTATYPSGEVLSMSYLTEATTGSVALTPAGGGSAVTYATYEAYTALGQAQRIRYDRSGVTVENGYFPIGPSYSQLQTTRASNGAGTLYARSYTWNPLNSLTGIADQQNAAASEAYRYDTQPANAHMGFLTRASGAYGTQDYAYDALGNVSDKAGVAMTYADGKDWLTATSAGAVLDYYANGNLKTQTDGGTAFAYTYDAGGLLVQVDRTADGQTESGYAAYDASGRRVFYQRIGDAQKTWRVTSQFEVVDRGDGTFQHTVYVPGTVTPIAAITADGKGNDGGAAMQAALRDLYGPRTLKGRALSAVHGLRAGLADAGRAAAPFGTGLLFAALGLFYVRSTRSRPGAEPVRPFYRWSTPLVLLCFLLGSPPPAYAALVPGANGAGVPTAGSVFFLPNALESTVLVTDQNGTVTATVAYTPDGAIDQPSSSGVDNFRPKFVGSEWDPTTALYHMGVRYYAPALGRFISPDPVGQFTSPYLYAGNNPVSAIDPDGDFAFAVAMIIGAVVGAYFGGATVNHDMNPLNWNWRSGKTYAGLAAGAAIGAVGAAAGGLAVEAGVAIGASGGLAAEAAGVAVGIGGQVLVGAGENAAFTALGGGSAKDVLQAAGEGALWSAAFAVAGEAMGGIASQFARRTGAAAEGLEESAASAARRESSAADDLAGDVCSASFVAGTPVIGAGGQVRPIESIAVGDRVAGRDVPAGVDADGTVSELVRRETDVLVRITLAGGERITTTPDHAFRGHQRGWIPAKDLGAGSLLDGADGQAIEVASVSIFQAQAPTRVYNFEVEGTHTYRVGEDGALVHNPKSKKARVCRARIDPYGVVTEEWNITELQRRYPVKKDYQAIQRDIRLKARNANKIINSGKVTARTRVGKPVKTASPAWVRYEWQRKFGTGSTPPKSIRAALAVLRKHFANQDVDEFLTRIQGGLTIREGMPENQGPINSFVNQTSGAAMGALSRSGPPQTITAIKPAFTVF